jgi:hypothetical protein
MESNLTGDQVMLLLRCHRYGFAAMFIHRRETLAGGLMAETGGASLLVSAIFEWVVG